jgi:DNA end-binding protein Ku
MRSIWKGSLGFGLVSIPVSLYPAEGPETTVRFHLLDGRTMEPVRQKRVNERTGEEVPFEDIIKGYEYEKGRWVVLSEDEIRTALPKSTGAIDIARFVREADIDPVYFSKPYYLEPGQGGTKPYALLREAMRSGGYVAIGLFVLRTKRYLAVVAPRGDALVLCLLRYAHELRDVGELNLPGQDLETLGVTGKELKMAGQLVDSMVEPWDPEAFQDDYFEQIMKLIQAKAEAGAVTLLEEAPAAAQGGEVVDIMALLKRSLDREKASGGNAPGTAGAADDDVAAADRAAGA